MFEIFKEAVRSAYLMKKDDRVLPYDELEKPSPGDLRSLFLLLMAGGLSPEDRDTFIHFFKYRGEYAELDTHIRRYDLDKFRPLRNYILGYTSNPSEDVVKMLAILIDFQPRPYRRWRENYLAGSTLESEEAKNKKRPEPIPPLKATTEMKKKKVRTPQPESSQVSVRNGLKLLLSIGILSTVAAVFIARD